LNYEAQLAGPVQTERRDRVGRGKLPSRKDRLHDFETMRNPIDEQVETTFEDKRFLLRSQLNGEASAALRAAGVAAPPTLRELP
jgi:hypothetical protein